MHADCLPLIPSSSSTLAASDELDLLERLWRLDGGWWRVAHLTSGRSGDVHGEVSTALWSALLISDIGTCE